ncbi:MAG: HAMP domain-containing histidine kinase [Fibrobacterales bacterium]
MADFSSVVERGEEALVDRLLKVFLWVACFAVTASIVRAFEIGWKNIMVFHLCVVVVMIFAVAGRARLVKKVKIYIMLGLTFVSGVLGLFSFGLVGGGVMLLFTSMTLAMAFGRKTIALWAMVGGGLSIVGIGLLAITGRHAFSVNVDRYHTEITSWLVIAASFLFFGYMVSRVIRNVNGNLIQALGQVEKQRAELDESNSLKNKLFSVIAHDLQRPFSGLVGIMGILSENDSAYTVSEKKELFVQIHRDSKNVYSLLENLLIWAQSQQDNRVLEKEVVGVDEVVTESFAPYRQIAAEKGVTVHIESCGYQSIYVNKASIKIVLSNLINNALKFTPQGGLVTLSCFGSGAEVDVSIADTGVGLKASAITSILSGTAFFSTQGTGNESGSGIGLRLCRELLDKNGGALAISSVLNEGSTFVITLPKLALTETKKLINS